MRGECPPCQAYSIFILNFISHTASISPPASHKHHPQPPAEVCTITTPLWALPSTVSQRPPAVILGDDPFSRARARAEEGYVVPVSNMAWKTPSKKKPANSAAQHDPPSFPGLSPAGRAKGSKTHFDELQQNEVMVLQSIYGDDMMDRTAAQGAWKVCSHACKQMESDRCVLIISRRNPSPRLMSESRLALTLKLL